MMKELEVPCLLCDTPVITDREEWDSIEAPFALCEDCGELVDCGDITWPMVKMLYIVRCQVSSLFTKMEHAERNIRNLFSAQKELEQEYVRPRRQS
jgi:hypothetical protein